MRPKVNLAVLKATKFDSGALGPLGMVVHQFGKLGAFHVGVHQGGRCIADTAFRVDESGPMQLTIDVAQGPKASASRAQEGCECTSGSVEAPLVSPKGYVLFHASSGDGYSVTVAGEDLRVVFDSTKLGEGDLFGVSLLQPGKYSMENRGNGARGNITVTLTGEDARRIKSLETQYVECSRSAFAPEHVNLISSQGLVFRGSGLERIVVEMQDRQEFVRQPKPIRRWTKPVVERRHRRSG